MMSNNILKQMCEEIKAQIDECIDILDDSYNYQRDSLKKEWQNKIIDTYKIMCEDV